MVYNFAKADFEKINDYILCYDFSTYYANSDNIEALWLLLKSVISESIECFVPKTLIRNKKEPKWFNSSIHHKSNVLRTLKRKIRRSTTSPSTYLLNKIESLTSELETSIQEAKSEYKSLFINQFARRSNYKIFSYINSLTKCGNNLPSEMHCGGKDNTSSIKTKADLFNKYFHSVYTVDEVNDINDSYRTNLTSISFHEGDVYNILSSLDPTKAGGIDEISASFLKHCSLGLCYPLHHLYSVSLAIGRIPQEWRTHLITPIYKSGDRSDYRPISLLPIVSKVLERIIYDRIVPHISQQLHPSQFGFSKGKSCLQQLLTFLHQLVNNNLQKAQSDTLYLDFRKAFDSISHNIVLRKLQLMGIGGSLLSWFRSYLNDRLQLVKIGNCTSELLPVTSGVPHTAFSARFYSLYLLMTSQIPSTTPSCICLQMTLKYPFLLVTACRRDFNYKLTLMPF